MKKFVATFLVVAMIIPVTGCGIAKRVLNLFMPKQDMLSATPNPFEGVIGDEGAQIINNGDGTVTIIVNGEKRIGIINEDGSYSLITIGTPLAPNATPTDVPKPVPTAAVSATPMYLTGNDVRVRTAPSTEASYFAHVSKGTMVYAYEQTNGFYRVMLTDGTEAYIMAKYLSTTPTTPDPTPVTTNVKVVDAVNYTKKIVAYISSENGYEIDPAQPDIGNHEIIVPKIVDNYSDDAENINDKMYKNVENIYNVLLQNHEESEIYRASYKYTNYNGIIGIVQFIFYGGQFQGGDEIPEFYYYDSINDRELTFDEYLSAIGLTKADFSKIISTEGTPLGSEVLENLSEAVFDENGGYYCIEYPDAPGGRVAFKTQTNLFN